MQQEILQRLLQLPEIRDFSAVANLEDPAVLEYLIDLFTRYDGNLSAIAVKLDIDAQTIKQYQQAQVPVSINTLRSIDIPTQQLLRLVELKQLANQPPRPTPTPTPQPQRIMPQPVNAAPARAQLQDTTPAPAPAPAPQIQPPPQPQRPTFTQYAPIVETRDTRDVVSPFVDKIPVVMTQKFNNYNPKMGYYAGLHKGEDYAYAGGGGGTVTNPIGGQVMSVGYDPAYGNTMVIRGYNPQEYRQLSAKDRANINKNEDYVRLSHLANLPNLSPGDYIATGSARMRMGNTGNSTGIHLDVEAGRGNPNDFTAKIPFSTAYPQMRGLAQNMGAGGVGGGTVPRLPERRPTPTPPQQPKMPNPPVAANISRPTLLQPQPRQQSVAQSAYKLEAHLNRPTVTQTFQQAVNNIRQLQPAVRTAQEVAKEVQRRVNDIFTKAQGLFNKR